MTSVPGFCSNHDWPVFSVLQISHRCETLELQRFPVLRRRMDDVVSHFLREGLIPAETMIGHLIEMEVRQRTSARPSFPRCFCTRDLVRQAIC